MKLCRTSLLALLLFFSGFTFADTMYDLTTSGASVTINGAIFTQGSQQAAGTGQFGSFLRIKANGTEYGYNTDEFPHPPLDIQPGAQWTHSLQLSAVPVFSFDGLTYYQFMLDINESEGRDRNLLSLDVLKFYTGTATSPQCCPPGGDFGAAHWSLDTGANNYILLDAALGHGSGSSDMYAYIPTSAFAGAGPNVYLYSGFGENNSSDGGFEEWGTGQQTATGVPEPSSILLLTSGLVGLSAGLLRKK